MQGYPCTMSSARQDGAAKRGRPYAVPVQTDAAPTTTRERILDAAMDLFAQDGFSGTTITEIERRVGLAAGTGSLYRHFPSKEALLRAAVEREVTRCRAAMEDARAALPPVADRDARRTQVYELILRDV